MRGFLGLTALSVWICLAGIAFAEEGRRELSEPDGSAEASKLLLEMDELLSAGKIKKAFARVDESAKARIVQCDGEQALDRESYRQIFVDLHSAVETYRRERSELRAVPGSVAGELVVRSVLVEHLAGPGFSGDGTSDEIARVRVDSGGKAVLVAVESRARCETTGPGDG